MVNTIRTALTAWGAARCSGVGMRKSGVWHLPFVLASVLLLAGMSGCALFRPAPPMTLPAGFLATPMAALMQNPATRQAAYAKLFPALPKVQMGGDLVAKTRWWRGKDHFQVLYLALDPEKPSGPRPLRLRGFIQQTSLFDVVVQGNLMTVQVYPVRQLFQGEIPPEGSPFARRYGVEPWDLVTVLTLGQQVASGDFTSGGGPATLRAKGSDPIYKIELDPASGLPRSAIWKARGDEYQIRYLGWNTFTDKLTQESRLMPSALEIRRNAPHITIRLTMDSYQFNKNISEAAFKLYVDNTYVSHPLSDLSKALGN